MFEMIPRGQALFDLDLSLKAPGTDNFFLLRTWHRRQPPPPSLCTFLPGVYGLQAPASPPYPGSPPSTVTHTGLPPQSTALGVCSLRF